MIRQHDKEKQTMAEQIKTASGLQYADEVVGDGASPTPGQKVTVHYTGTFPDGRKFDSSRDRNDPFVFTIGKGQVIKGWDEGVLTMKVGGRRILTVPSRTRLRRAGRGRRHPAERDAALRCRAAGRGVSESMPTKLTPDGLRAGLPGQADDAGVRRRDAHRGRQDARPAPADRRRRLVRRTGALRRGGQPGSHPRLQSAAVVVLAGPAGRRSKRSICTTIRKMSGSCRRPTGC